MSVNVAIGVYRRKKEYRRMKVLILSCNTGEGHNSAGKAVKEYIESQGDMAEFRDMMMLGGKKNLQSSGRRLCKCSKALSSYFCFIISVRKDDFLS